jgi:hypothetical protein
LLYGDDEIEALHGRLVASMAPAETMQGLDWMARALNPCELAALLTDMRTKAPPEAFGAALGLVRQALSPQRWARLAQSLGLSLGHAPTPAA